jgi:hypothetical protein
MTLCIVLSSFRPVRANCIKKRNDPEAITFNPLSGKVRQEFTKLRQARLTLVNLLGNRARN